VHLVPAVRQAGRADSRQLVGNEQPVCSYMLKTSRGVSMYMLKTSRGVSMTCYAITLDASRSIAMTSYYSLTFKVPRRLGLTPMGGYKRRSSDFCTHLFVLVQDQTIYKRWYSSSK
jgi:hypothetical protein